MIEVVVTSNLFWYIVGAALILGIGLRFFVLLTEGMGGENPGRNKTGRDKT